MRPSAPKRAKFEENRHGKMNGAVTINQLVTSRPLSSAKIGQFVLP